MLGTAHDDQFPLEFSLRPKHCRHRRDLRHACLNEVRCLPHCIANAKAALAKIHRTLGLSGEIVIADNASTDGNQELARKLGARVVAVVARGYGAALMGGG